MKALPLLALAPTLALGLYAVGCGDNPSTTAGASSSASSSASSGGESSSSASSSSTGAGGGTGGMSGAGGAGGAGGAVGAGGMGGAGGAVGAGGMGGAGGATGASVWSKRYGDFDGQYGRTVGADAMGDVYVAGIFYSQLDLGGGAMTSNGLDGYLTKLDPSGNQLWTRQFGGPLSQYAAALAVDAAGSVVVTGSFGGTVDFGGGPLTAVDVDVFVAKYDAAGNHLWSKRYGGADTQSAGTVALDPAGNVVVGGTFLGSIDFGGGAMTATDYDLFAVKLDASGNYVFSRHFDQQDANQPEMMAVAFDGAGNMALTGYFFGSMDLGGGPLTSAGNYDVFLVKLGPNGQHLWSKRYGAALGQNPNGLGFDGAGNLFMAGTIKGSIDLGGGALTSAGNDDIWLAKLDPAGAHVWSKRFGDAQQQFVTDLAVSPAGDLALVASVGGSTDFGGGPLVSAGGLDIAVARLDPSGNHVWSHRAGDALTQSSDAIALDPAGYVLLAGELVGSADFGSGVLTSAGSSDLFIAKLAP